MDVTSDAVQIISKPLAEYTTARNGNLNPFDTNTVIPGFLLNEKIILIRGNKFEAINIAISEPSASVALVDSASGPLVLQTWNDEAKVSQIAFTRFNRLKGTLSLNEGNVVIKLYDI